MKFVAPSKVSGEIAAPSSKSVTQRALFAAWLAPGESNISNVSLCEDGKVALAVISALGAKVQHEKEVLKIVGGSRAANREIDCGESGLCIRMMCALSPLAGGDWCLTGKGSLLKRPLGPIEKPLAVLGVECKTSGGCAPVHLSGQLDGGVVEVDGSQSSQFVSGLLMALPTCKKDSELQIKNLSSKPYVGLTLQVIKAFGVKLEASEGLDYFKIVGGQRYRATNYQIEGDWSGASCMLVAGAIAGEVEVDNLSSTSLQADRVILDVLKMSGAEVDVRPSAIRVCSKKLRGFDFDASDCPDLFPALVALACSCQGKTTLRGCQRLLSKESNRLETLISEFSKLGACLVCRGNSLEIEGTELKGGSVYSHGDHRIAMACATAALRSKQGVSIEGEGAVSKSYPEFFEDLQSIMEQ